MKKAFWIIAVFLAPTVPAFGQVVVPACLVVDERYMPEGQYLDQLQAKISRLQKQIDRRIEIKIHSQRTVNLAGRDFLSKSFSRELHRICPSTTRLLLYVSTNTAFVSVTEQQAKRARTKIVMVDGVLYQQVEGFRSGRVIYLFSLEEQFIPFRNDGSDFVELLFLHELHHFVGNPHSPKADSCMSEYIQRNCKIYPSDIRSLRRGITNYIRRGHN